MILADRDRIHDVAELVAGLLRARKNVVRVSVAERATASSKWLASGFLLTPHLVVAPGFIDVPADSVARLEFPGEGGEVQQFLSDPSPEQLGHISTEYFTGAALTLFSFGAGNEGRRETSGSRETKAADAGLLELCFDAPAERDFVAIPQFTGRGKKLQVSFGSIVSASDEALDYDADTEGGSSGAPILDRSWRVIGMHLAGHQKGRKLNTGLARKAMVDALRASRHWDAIRNTHRIADVAAAAATLAGQHDSIASGAVGLRVGPAVATEAEADLLVRAALQSSVLKASLTDAEAKQLRPLVIDPNADRWVMRSADRTRIIQAVGSLDALRAARPRARTAAPEAVQQIIDRVLTGPPYDLEAEDEAALASWIQVVRWFTGVVPSLPSAAEVLRTLERKRMHSRLTAIAGVDFRGRTEQLQQLDHWWRRGDGPLSLTGIGGVGKSALIARFASTLPAKTLLLWLDFDRADLAPDDAASVMAVIAQQASVQLAGFTAPAIDDAWEQSAGRMGEELERALPPDAEALLVLDSFEAAQYAERYQELWPVLDAIARAFPRLRLVVTGRAPVPELRLAGRAAQEIRLGGLERADSAAWLREHGVVEPALVDRVLDLADGVPLILRLVEAFVERGGTAEDLPQRLTNTVITGFLYDRILDRVQNSELKPVARAALVLRRLTMDLVTAVFADVVEFPPGEISEWFAELGREMALVEGTDVLRLRPEVRSAALSWLQKDQPEMVKLVDQRAAEWYATQDVHDPEVAAELVYHRLRLGDLAGAEDGWRDGCGRFLTGAAEDLEGAARYWLEARLGAVSGDVHESSKAYEQNAAERIRSARSRGHRRAARGILNERPREHTNDSPLVFQEAYEQWLLGTPHEAARLLDEAGDAPGRVGRDRRVLRALLWRDADGRLEADELLGQSDGLPAWSDGPDASLRAAAVRTARVRLAVDIDAECALLADAATLDQLVGRLSPIDVVLPRLRERLSQMRVLEASAGLRAVDVGDGPSFHRIIEAVRQATTPSESASIRQVRARAFDAWTRESWASVSRQGAHGPVSREAGGAQDDPGIELGLGERLATLGWRRWWIAAQSLANDVMGPALHSERLTTPLGLGVVGTLALWASDLGPLEYELAGGHRYDTLRFVGPLGSLRDLVFRLAPLVTQKISAQQWQRVLRALQEGVEPKYPWAEHARVDTSMASESPVVTFTGDLGRLPVSRRGMAFYLLSPDPLETLVKGLAGDSSAAQ